MIRSQTQDLPLPNTCSENKPQTDDQADYIINKMPYSRSGAVTYV